MDTGRRTFYFVMCLFGKKNYCRNKCWKENRVLNDLFQSFTRNSFLRFLSGRLIDSQCTTLPRRSGLSHVFILKRRKLCAPIEGPGASLPFRSKQPSLERDLERFRRGIKFPIFVLFFLSHVAAEPATPRLVAKYRWSQNKAEKYVLFFQSGHNDSRVSRDWHFIVTKNNWVNERQRNKSRFFSKFWNKNVCSGKRNPSLQLKYRTPNLPDTPLPLSLCPVKRKSWSPPNQNSTTFPAVVN